MQNPLLDVLRLKKPNSKTPIWLMRQAGRYLPEYRELRKSYGGFLEMAMDDQAACEITLQPLRRFDLDAAIIFSDILMVPYGLGQSVQFIEGQGPQLGALKIKELKLNQVLDRVSPTLRALERVSKELGPETALIGFAGAPWTIMAYMIQGKSSRDFEGAVNYIYAHPQEALEIQNLVVEATCAYLIAQVQAGAQVIQLFDSWAGFLPQALWQDYVMLPTQRIVDAFRKSYPDIPFIWFPKGIGSRCASFPKGISAISLDQYTDLNLLARYAPKDLVWQGGLDPAALRAGGDILINHLEQLFDQIQGRPYIFNLGHGMTPDIPIDHVQVLIHWIRQKDQLSCQTKPLSSSI